jgi:hypothetical protein
MIARLALRAPSLPLPRRDEGTAVGGWGVRSREHAESRPAWALDGATRLERCASLPRRSHGSRERHPPTPHRSREARHIMQPHSSVSEACLLIRCVKGVAAVCVVLPVRTRAGGGRGAGPLPATVASARCRSAARPNLVAPSRAGSAMQVSVLREGAPPPGPHSRWGDRAASIPSGGRAREASGGGTRGRSRGRRRGRRSPPARRVRRRRPRRPCRSWRPPAAGRRAAAPPAGRARSPRRPRR